MKYIVKQYFDTYFENEWVFEDKKEAEKFYEKKLQESMKRYKVSYRFFERKEKEEDERD